MFCAPLEGSADTEGSAPLALGSLEEVGLSEANAVAGSGALVVPVLSCSFSGWTGLVDELQWS